MAHTPTIYISQGAVMSLINSVAWRGNGALRRQLSRAFSGKAPPEFKYTQMFQEVTPDPTPYKRLEEASKYVSTFEANGKTFLKVDPKAIELLTTEAMNDIAHLLRPGHLQQLSNIMDDSEASANDKFVAIELLKNAAIAAYKILPGCQDTGSAIVMAKRGQYVWTDGEDEAAISKGVYNTYTGTNLRYSQVSPHDMYKETNTGTNLPVQMDIYATKGDAYKFLFMAKGGGSANKTFLYQETKALLNPKRLMEFAEEKIKTLGTSACPPYHLAFVVGGMSAEMTLKTVKLASAKELDQLPTVGGPDGQAFRDVETEAKILKMTQDLGIGAQFGGKYFCHDIRVIRLPRHGASVPVGLGVSCSADRQAKAKITKDGVFLEQLEENPDKYIPEVKEEDLAGEVVKIDLNQPMASIRATLSQYPIKTRVSLTGTVIVARDIAHAKILERLEAGEGMPDYIKNHPVYYAGPAKTPEGYASGSFGPTTAGRMDSYVDRFQAEGGSMVMLAKGNRSKAVTNACKKHGGFYLGSIGGNPAEYIIKSPY
jgi:fumarate hydratase class I